MNPEITRIEFAGPNSHEPLLLGSHVTIRRARPPYTRLEVHDRLLLVDMENMRSGGALVKDFAHGLYLPDLLTLDDSAFEGERSHLHSAEAVVRALMEYYPDATDTTPFMAIEFITYVSEAECE